LGGRPNRLTFSMERGGDEDAEASKEAARRLGSSQKERRKNSMQNCKGRALEEESQRIFLGVRSTRTGVEAT